MAKKKPRSVGDAKDLAKARMFARIGDDRATRKAKLAKRVLALTENAQFTARMSDDIESEAQHDMSKIVAHIEAGRAWVDNKGNIVLSPPTKAQKAQIKLAEKRVERAGQWSQTVIEIAQKAAKLID